MSAVDRLAELREAATSDDPRNGALEELDLAQIFERDGWSQHTADYLAALTKSAPALVALVRAAEKVDACLVRGVPLNSGRGQLVTYVSPLHPCPGLPGKPGGVVTPRPLCVWCQRTLDAKARP